MRRCWLRCLRLDQQLHALHAFMVVHRPSAACAATIAAWNCHPAACPTCGNVDLQPLGRGTQRVEEGLQAIFPARVLRIDADSTRLKGSAQSAFDSVHRGEVDILVGTQMVAKGHDFKSSRWWACSIPIRRCSRTTTAPASACSPS
jgi:hypothetical protein